MGGKFGGIDKFLVLGVIVRLAVVGWFAVLEVKEQDNGDDDWMMKRLSFVLYFKGFTIAITDDRELVIRRLRCPIENSNII